jgi:hypothetical protein
VQMKMDKTRGCHRRFILVCPPPIFQTSAAMFSTGTLSETVRGILSGAEAELPHNKLATSVSALAMKESKSCSVTSTPSSK